MRIYNTLTRRKEEFTPAGDEVALYVCGITSSDYSHVGHALSAIAFEVLHRYLEYRGYRVIRVQNFTDIDDKVIARARDEGVPAAELAEKYIQAFIEDFGALNFKLATVHPRATEEIPAMIDMVSALVARGAAYESGGSVYFRVRKHPGYGKLSGRTIEEMLAGTRFEVEPGKEHPADFALWKASKPGEPAWESPWGPGRPGWHIECSAMAYRHLGETIDIHGGGLDLIFPHHENELAQSEAFTGRPFARIWMHNGLLQLSGAKMSKSLGNLVRIRDVLAAHSADGVRLWLLSSHYRSPLVYDEAGLAAQDRAAQRLRNAMARQSPAGTAAALDAAPYEERFVRVMDDDLNTPQAIAVIFDLAREINRAADAGERVDLAQAKLRELSGVLGLTLATPATSADGLSDREVERLIEERAQLRMQRRFQEADAIRARLGKHGVAIADSPQGTSWSRK